MAGRDVVFVGVLFFALAILFFIVLFVTHTFNDALLANSQVNQSSSTVAVLKSSTTNSNKLDYVFGGVFLGFLLSILITSWLIGAHPIFMIIYFIFIVLSVVFSAFFSNVWETTTQSSVFGSTIINMPITNHVLLNLPMYMAVVGVAGFLAMFAKPYQEV
jgi:hypothetical protein